MGNGVCHCKSKAKECWILAMVGMNEKSQKNSTSDNILKETVLVATKRINEFIHIHCSLFFSSFLLSIFFDFRIIFVMKYFPLTKRDK